MRKLQYPPEKTSFSVQDLGRVRGVRLDGPKPLIFKDYANGMRRASVKWISNRTYFEYIRFFYHGTANGALPFLIDLSFKTHSIETFVAYIAPGTFKLAQMEGHRFSIEAELYIIEQSVYG